MGLRRRGSRSAGAATDGGSDAQAVVATATKKAGRAARKAGAATEHAGTELARRNRKPLTVSRAKRMIGVGKAVAPLLAPYALAAAGVARARWDAYRAARLGVEPGQLAAFSGPGGALHARLSRLAEALDRLDSMAEARATNAAGRFTADTRPRLADLAVAVRAAEQMPASRRRTAFRAIGRELDRLETELLAHLGIDTTHR
jgi:Family of unknown function (DUF6474)